MISNIFTNKEENMNLVNLTFERKERVASDFGGVHTYACPKTVIADLDTVRGVCQLCDAVEMVNGRKGEHEYYFVYRGSGARYGDRTLEEYFKMHCTDRDVERITEWLTAISNGETEIDGVTVTRPSELYNATH